MEDFFPFTVRIRDLALNFFPHGTAKMSYPAIFDVSGSCVTDGGCGVGSGEGCGDGSGVGVGLGSVSYTHLTLPTK